MKFGPVTLKTTIGPIVTFEMIRQNRHPTEYLRKCWTDLRKFFLYLVATILTVARD